jgi:opine dehydrogenase
MMRRKVTIMGGGNGARATAAELGIVGHDVNLFEVPEFFEGMKGIVEAREIRSTGEVQGTGPVLVTSDIVEAVDGSDLIIIVVPTMHHRDYAKLLAPVLQDGMNVALMPGSMGSLEFVEYVHAEGYSPDITVSEFAALPYATRISGPAEVHVFGRRKIVSIGVFPSDQSDRVLPIANDLYPGIELMSSVLEAGLSNPNPTLHCLGVLLSSSRIEYSHGEFYYYEEGLTPHVCQAVEAIDEERVNIGKALGLEILSLKDTYWRMGYGPKGDTFWSVIRGVAALHDIKGPAGVDSRYLTEDVPIGLTIYSQLGRQLGVDTKLMESVINLVSALLSRDFVAEGRTLTRCGIEGMTKDQLLYYVKTGIRH